jgi:hypothetical protein
MAYEREGSRKVWVMSKMVTTSMNYEQDGVKRNMDHERERSRKVWIMSERGQEKYGF